MNKLITLLSAVLAVQVILAAILFGYRGDTGAFHSDQSLLGLSQDGFDAVSIEQKDKPALTLKKDKDVWLLPGYFNVPVDNGKFDDFSRKLLALKTSWPVANTEDAAERFQVNKDKYERKIVFQKDGKPVKTLYLGTSPGFKKIHARIDGNNDIQSIDFAAFEASVTPEDWMKQDLAKIDPSQISQIKGNDFTLVKADKDWAVEGLPANQTSNAAEIKAFTDKLAALNYSAVLGVEDKPEYHLKEPALLFTFNKHAEEIQYRFGKQDGQDDYVLKTSSQPFYFKIGKGLVDSLKEFNLKKLSQVKPAENPPQPSAPSVKK